MSSTIKQIYDSNPATELKDDDLLYIGRSPYGSTNDMAIKSQSIFPSSVETTGNLASYSDTTGKQLADSKIRFSGGFTFVGTLTADTTVTFPTSGTLATTASIPSFPLEISLGGTGATTATAAIGNLGGIAADGSIPLSADWDAGSHTISTHSFKVTGTAGAGFIEIPVQSTQPSVGPANSNRIFSSSTGDFGFVPENNPYSRFFKGTLTQERNYTLQDANDVIVMRGTTDTLTNKTYDTAGTGNLFYVNGTLINDVSGDLSSSTVPLLTKGSFTPTLAFGGGSTGITYGTQIGQYTSMGNIIYFFCRLAITNKGSDTGNATIGGLPVANGSNEALYGSVVGTNMTFSGNGQVIGFTGSGESLIRLIYPVSTTTNGTYDDTAFSNTTDITINGFYFTT